MSFANPLWLLGLLAVPLALAALVAQRRRARRYAVRFTGVQTLKLAALGVPAWRRYVPPALTLLALSALVLALAKPQRTVAVPVGRASIMLVTDHSLSMVADDVRPDRLTAAQNAARTFIKKLPRQVAVGVVTFSDSPDAVQAPSQDHSAAQQLIDSQQAGGATDTGDALDVAIQALTSTGQKGKRPPSSIVLLSDGRTTTGRDPVGVAREAARLHIPIYTVALGTANALIPNPSGFGPPVEVPPDPATLRQIARISGGRAFTAEDAGELSSIYKSLGSQLGTRGQKREITASFAVAGLALLIAAGAASLRIAGRLP